MSADWGTLVADPAWRDIDAGPAAPRAPEFEPDAGQWPEEVDVEYLVDSARTIPGMGAQPRNCGIWAPREFCSECGEPVFGESRCATRGCPNCWHLWSRNRTESETIRLSAARHAADAGLDKRAVHAVVSPPEESVRTESELKAARKHAYTLAEEHGVRGGMVIEHGFRLTEEAAEMWLRQRLAGETELKKWRWVREHALDWRKLTYWSPHFHVVGLSREFEPNDPDGDDGWIVERLSTLDPFTLTDPTGDGYESMIRCIRYLLSHTSFDPEGRSHAITWFGELAYNKFSPEKAISRGALKTIERRVEELLGPGDEEDLEDGEEAVNHADECPCDGCTGELWSIWDARYRLQDADWCDSIGREQQRRLVVAWEWAIGDVVLPPGLQRPESETECEEAFATLYEMRYG